MRNMLTYLSLYWKFRQEYKTLDSLDRLVQGNRFALLPFATGYIAFLVTLLIVLAAFVR